MQINRTIERSLVYISWHYRSSRFLLSFSFLSFWSRRASITAWASIGTLFGNEGHANRRTWYCREDAKKERKRDAPSNQRILFVTRTQYTNYTSHRHVWVHKVNIRLLGILLWFQWRRQCALSIERISSGITENKHSSELMSEIISINHMLKCISINKLPKLHPWRRTGRSLFFIQRNWRVMCNGTQNAG